MHKDIQCIDEEQRLFVIRQNNGGDGHDNDAIYGLDGLVTPCSFVEHVYEDDAIDLLNASSTILDSWMDNDMLNRFRNCSKCSKSCPIYALDCK